MREYEAMIISKMDVPEPDMIKMVGRWESILSTNGGEIIKKDNWGVRRLAYQIQKQNRANYIVYDVATTQENIKEFERVLKFNENVLRYLVTKISDDVDVVARKLELKEQAEEVARREAESVRERSEGEALNARRGPREDE